MDRPQVKVGVKEGGGKSPGYKWSVWILDLAYADAMGFLRDEQYEHLAMQFKDLASHDDPTHSSEHSVRDMRPESYYELRDKGGILGNLNVRVFFSVDKEHRAIVILGCIKKQNDGPTPLGDVIRIRRRWRKYQNGEYGAPPGRQA